MPSIKLRKGNTLVLYGPASALLVEGKASVLGCPLSPRRRLVVKSWRSRPIYAELDSVIDFTYGEEGGYEVIDGDTIPEEWRRFAEKVSENPSRTCVYGGADSGKTTLATLMANAFVRNHGSSLYFDLDLGQSNICPPTTVGYTLLRRPIPDISYLRMESGEVVGYTSPTPLIDKHLQAVKSLMSRILKAYAGFSISMDLDGWVSEEGGIKHKRAMLRILKPDSLASIGEMPGEIEEACEELGISYEVLPPPTKLRRREQIARKRLREIAYERFLRKSVVRKIPVSWVKLKTITDKSSPREIREHIEAIIRSYAEYSGEILDTDSTKALEELARRGIGILSYVRDMLGGFAGIGLLIGLDLRKNHFKLLTPYQAQIKELILGAILLSTSGEEIYSNPKIFLEDRRTD